LCASCNPFTGAGTDVLWYEARKDPVSKDLAFRCWRAQTTAITTAKAITAPTTTRAHGSTAMAEFVPPELDVPVCTDGTDVGGLVGGVVGSADGAATDDVGIRVGEGVGTRDRTPATGDVEMLGGALNVGAVDAMDAVGRNVVGGVVEKKGAGDGETVGADGCSVCRVVGRSVGSAVTEGVDGAVDGAVVSGSEVDDAGGTADCAVVEGLKSGDGCAVKRATGDSVGVGVGGVVGSKVGWAVGASDVGMDVG